MQSQCVFSGLALLSRLSASLLLFMLSTTLAHAAVFHTTLENGLTVLIDEQHANPIVSVQVFVRTGSLYEQEYLGSGISHFFEHVLHGGSTATRSEEDTRLLLEAIGNQTNAYTTVDHTAYYITTATEHWRTALELLSDWLLHSQIAHDEFAREKGVVQRELEQGLDNPAERLAQLALETRYQVHPMRYPVIGYKALVQRISRDDLATYYQRMYAPNNMLLVLVGDVNTASALEDIRRTFGQGPPRPLPSIVLPAEPRQLGKRVAVKEMPVSQASLSLSFRTVPVTHEHMYPLDVLAYILGNGDSSRLVQRIRAQQQLVYDLRTYSFTPPYVEGSLSVTATLEPEQIDNASTAILQEMSRLRDELVTPEELAKAKKQKVADYLFERQDVEQRGHALGIDMLSTYDPHFSETYLRGIQRVSAEDIQTVARLYLQEETLVQAIVRPPVPGLSTTPVQTSSSNIEPVVKKVLPNGLTLLLQRDTTWPTVALYTALQAGVRVETPETNGLSQLTASLLVKGTSTRSAEDIAALFDAKAATLAADSGYHSIVLHTTCLREDFPALLEVYADLLLHPTFPEAELANARRVLLANVERINDDWRSEAERLWQETFFTVSPYRLAPAGSRTVLQRLQRQDVTAFYQRYAVPGNMVLAIVGDIAVERTAQAVEHLFAAWSAAPRPALSVAAEPLPTQTRRVAKPTQKQIAGIFMGFPGTTLSNLADRYPLHLLDAIVSGLDLPGGWLHQELRGQQLVYVVHAFNWLGLESGYFGIYAGTQPDRAEYVVETILQTLQKARDGQISEDELKRAKQMALVTARLHRQTNDQRASDMALNELYGLGYDFSARNEAYLRQVSLADVHRVAQTYLHHPSIVITTPATP
ncbi:MAG: M16 family metallopeptidase [Candidatus Tectimicrobiota bacterium]